MDNDVTHARTEENPRYARGPTPDHLPAPSPADSRPAAPPPAASRPASGASSFDPVRALAEPAALPNPHPVFDELRSRDPVAWHDGLGTWLLTRHADCVAVLRDGARFGADPRRAGVAMPPQAVSVQTLDPPGHTAARRPLVDALRELDRAETAPMVAERARALLDGLSGRSSFDVVTDFCEPLTVSTICRYLRVPEPDPAWLAPVAETVAAGMDGGVFPERLEPAMAARADLSALTDGWLADPPPDGIVRAVADAVKAGELDRVVAANTLRVLLHAGYTSASKLLSLAVITLLERPGALEAFAADPSPRAVDELARFCSPVQALGRVCVAPAELGGRKIEPGQDVTLFLGAANRDPARFDAPHDLRPDRHPNPHLGFGRGSHSCLGAPFAAVQTRTVLAVLAERSASLRALGAPDYRVALTLRSPARMRVALGRAGSDVPSPIEE
ncbi:cytochrome P450 [Actinomadura oligospora]|uniref:cytochrome P450 n=1 Tax=Actinomadura oligospora TaxID=111804 RepID=UPI0004AD2763|nr:cytochrome P450 [Actinomadura oligospora]